MALLEEVFKISGLPTYTFVEPFNYTELRVSIRTAGRCVVVEGPSGIGKTTSVVSLVKEIYKTNALILSARKTDDVKLIRALPNFEAIGVVVIDDFHRLEDDLKAIIADFMKVLADEGRIDSKLIIIGINKAGDDLVKFGNDLGLRLDVFRFEANPVAKIIELIEKGEKALNVKISVKLEIANRVLGSFQLCQLLCHQLCVLENITENSKESINTSIALDVVIERVMASLRRSFHSAAIEFARGSRLHLEGRAPYLHILRWLSESAEWSLDLREASKTHTKQRASVSQVIEKGFLERVLNQKALGDLLVYQPSTSVLSVEDPRFVFYLRNLVWRNFVKEVGYKNTYFKGRYDIALSFAGEDRAVAKQLATLLTEREISVFYDMNEQHLILAKNLEEYLGPIYRSEATYVVPILSSNYPRKIWTKFESEQFKERFGTGSIFPIRFSDIPEGVFSNTSNSGGLTFDPSDNQDRQLEAIVEIIAKRLEDDRIGSDIFS